MFKRQSTFLLMAFMVLFLIQAPAAATLITTGVEDFETLPLTGWGVNAATKQLLTEPGGNHYGLIAGNGGAYQTFLWDSSFTTLDFDYAVGSKGASQDVFRVVLYSESGSLVLFEQDINPSNNVLVDPDFINVSLKLDGYDLSSFYNENVRLSFEIVDGDSKVNSAFAFDNVALRTGAPVPEPATLFLCGTGVTLLVFWKRRSLLHRS
jgi:hypothetical protein